MIRSNLLAGGLAILSLSAFAVGAEETGLAVAANPLSKAEIDAAARTDALSIPTPGELLAALGKLGKLDWTSKFRAPIATSFPSRAQMALNLGGLIADGYIAVEAEDAQQVKNLGKDILALGKNLGVSKEILDRGKSLTEFADNKQWDVLKEELEATQNEVKEAMERNKDPDLVRLVTLGGWIRGTEVLSGWVSEHYTEAGAKLLRQPGIVGFLSSGVEALPEKIRSENCVKKTQAKLKEIEAAVSFPRETPPTQASVKQLHQLSADLMKDLARKDPK
ncbi:MAG TPA: hypothetical protein VFD27_22305 [Chthoniobacteraceae bacterium]|jgi:hypothetical protein|nr:hypothetical protein [Chthoniobacteraceae bacterium]